MARDQADVAGPILVPGPFVLPPAVRQTIADHARRDRPLECCGLLVGRGRAVTAAVAMRNVEASATRFRLDAREHVALMRALRLVSPPLSVVGVYHSHPAGPARPSRTDLAEAFYPEWLYVVAGVAGARVRVRGFVLAAGQMRPVRLRARPEGTIP
jgi:proteasome lid subunit RPN8/RPN11